jgi:hypothetical protein
MFSAMKTMAVMWMDPGMVDDDQIPARFGTGTLVVWTAAGVLLSAAVSAAEAVISGGSSLLSLVAALTMFLPSAMAFLAEPPRRGLGLGLGAAAGTASGVAVAYAGGGVLTLHWSLFLGLSVGALVAAFTFGRLTRDTDPPPPNPSTEQQLAAASHVHCSWSHVRAATTGSEAGRSGAISPPNAWPERST